MARFWLSDSDLNNLFKAITDDYLKQTTPGFLLRMSKIAVEIPVINTLGIFFLRYLFRFLFNWCQTPSANLDLLCLEWVNLNDFFIVALVYATY